MSERARAKVLIVDDANIFRNLVRNALCTRFPGLDVIEARDVAEGYHHVNEYRPRLVLLDVSLPDGNGLHLARRIRDELPEVVVCICTSYDFPEYRQAATECGAAHFISKNGDTFWRDTENLVRTELRLAGSDWASLEDRGKAGP